MSRTRIRPAQLTADIVRDHAIAIEHAEAHKRPLPQHKDDCDCRRCVTRRKNLAGHNDPLKFPYYAIGGELVPFPVLPNGKRLC